MLTKATFSVVISNQGSAAADAFWVDLYINPAGTPTVNQRWNDLCSLSPCYGLAWYVSSGLGAGQSVTLTSDSGSYAADFTLWPGYFTSGTTDLSLYVDSWNPGVSSGGILEIDESNNSFTLSGGVTVTGLGTLQTEGLPSATTLPSRPAHLGR